MSLTLSYWNGRGLMEVARMMLAIAGRFPGEGYTDDRRSAPPDSGAECNLGRLPFITTPDGRHIGQSAAIYYYVASETGLMGKSSFEAAEIISIQEHLKELNTAYRAIVPWGATPTDEQNEQWFNSGATDATGAADGSARSTRFMKWWVGRIENSLTGVNGFAVGDSLSLADVLIYYAFAETLSPEQGPNLPSSRTEPFANKALTDAAIANSPRIKASIAAVASNENLQRWLATRGVQGF